MEFKDFETRLERYLSDVISGYNEAKSFLFPRIHKLQVNLDNNVLNIIFEKKF